MCAPVSKRFHDRRGLPALLFLALIAPAGFAQKTSTTLDDKFDFSRNKHYAWRENRLVTRQHPDTNEIMDLKIVKAVNQQLALKGFTEVKDNPDFYVYYDGGGDTNLLAGGQGQANSASVTPADRAPTYGLGNGPGLAPSTWLKVNGEIVFHIVRAESGKPVWQAIYRKRYHDPDKALRNMDKEVAELVKQSFKDFPPKSKK